MKLMIVKVASETGSWRFKSSPVLRAKYYTPEITKVKILENALENSRFLRC